MRLLNECENKAIQGATKPQVVDFSPLSTILIGSYFTYESLKYLYKHWYKEVPTIEMLLTENNQLLYQLNANLTKDKEVV